jgi:hypothetical protein
VRSLVPLDTQTILGSVARTHRLFTVEENPRLCGWGAEIVSIVADEAFYDLDGPPVRITTPHIPLPAADIWRTSRCRTSDRIVERVRKSMNRSPQGANECGDSSACNEPRISLRSIRATKIRKVSHVRKSPRQRSDRSLDRRPMAQSSDGARFDVIDPATENTVASVASATVDDAKAAVDAASEAFPAWAAKKPRERGEILRKAFELIMRDAERLAKLITIENGKALSDSRGEVAYAAEFFRWFAEEGVRNIGQVSVAPASGARIIAQHRPAGVAVLVTPWNFPAAMATRKIGPRLRPAARWCSSPPPTRRSRCWR